MAEVPIDVVAGGPEDFATRVATAVAGTGPLCAGIDPSAALLGRWGLPDDADGLHSFGLRCVEAFAGVVPVVKPQVAFFERRGSAGMAALEATMAAAREAGLLVIADAKRADIGNTMEAYADAWLDPASPLCADAVTAVPYLGMGALAPMIDRAGAGGRGVIVVTRTSNSEGRPLQQSLTDGGTGPSVEDMVLGQIAGLNHGGQLPWGTVGAVVGATLQPSAFPLATLGGVILAPGVGAQGATADDVGALFAGCAPGSVLAHVSRSLLAAGPEVGQLTGAARRACEEMAAALGR
jgi:orotidine-5'-phosphate decarboxylase